MIKKIGKLLFLNILWLLFSLPVITIGASTCAAFSVTLKLVDDEEISIWGQFIKGFKQSWLQGIFMGLFTAACSISSVFIWKRVLMDVTFWPLIGAIAFTILIIVINFYAFPLIARYTNSFKNVIKNSISVFLQFFKPSLKSVLLVAIEVAILVLSRYIFLIPILFIPAVIIYTISIQAKENFIELEKRLSEKEETVEDEVEEETTESSEETE